MDLSTRRTLPWIVAIAFFMQTLDATILNTALPRMAADLQESPLRMQSVVVAYLLTVALLIPASGWLADRFGTRRVFVAAIGLFTLGSLACAMSPSLPLLVAARVLQGVGGALLLPVGRLAILRAFPRDDLLRALTFVTLPGLVGPLVGPTLGGWLVQVASWHWIFLINLPVGLLGAVAAARCMPELRGASRQRFDARGFVLFGAGMVMLSLSLQGLGERALDAAGALLLLCAGLACLAGYWLHAARTPAPLFGLQLFRMPTYSVGLLGNLFARLGSGAMPFLTPLLLQVGLGYSPAAAGMSMIPGALGAMLSKTFAERLIKRLGYRRVLVGNTLALAGLIASFALVQRDSQPLQVLLQVGLFGIVNSLQFSAMNTLTLGSLDERSASSGNSLLSVVMQLSMSLGVAAAAALLMGFGGPAQAPGSEGVLRTFQATYVCVGLMSAAAAFIFAQLRDDAGERPRAARPVGDGA